MIRPSLLSSYGCILTLVFMAGCSSGRPDAHVHEQVPLSAEEIRPLLVGAEVPQLTLKKADGKPFDLNAAIAEKPAILVFYRGSWCPYCNTQLSGLAGIEKKLTGLGYQLIAISTDRTEKVEEAMAKHGFSYRLLSDNDMAAAKAFGIAFKVSDTLIQKYKTYKIDLEDASGKDHHLLPVPSIFIVSTDGKILFEYVNPDYRVRLDPQLLLTAARSVMKKK